MRKGLGYKQPVSLGLQHTPTSVFRKIRKTVHCITRQTFAQGQPLIWPLALQ